MANFRQHCAIICLCLSGTLFSVTHRHGIWCLWVCCPNCCQFFATTTARRILASQACIIYPPAPISSEFVDILFCFATFAMFHFRRFVASPANLQKVLATCSIECIRRFSCVTLRTSHISWLFWLTVSTLPVRLQSWFAPLLPTTNT